MSLTKAEQTQTMVEPIPQSTNILINKRLGYIQGIVLTLVLALLADTIARLPYFSVMGIMIISILLGIGWNTLMGTPTHAVYGITFSNKILLRTGIILMGLRLNLSQIVEAGLSIILIDMIVVVFTVVLMLYLGKLFSVDKYLSVLLAVGTAVCGAAAIVAVAQLIRAKKELIAVSIACISILGTIGTIMYSLLFPLLGIDSYHYGVLVGSTLHELAHVIAAAVPGGETSSKIAILVKLGRVALLIPLAIIIGLLYASKNEKIEEKKRIKNLPVPWFIFGFLGMCLVNTFGFLSETIVQMFISLSVFLLSMAMAGLGLSINLGSFKNVGIKAVLVGVLGFIALTAISPLLLQLS